MSVLIPKSSTCRVADRHIIVYESGPIWGGVSPTDMPCCFSSSATLDLVS